MTKTTTGFAVRNSDGDGYYDMNGIGDWSLAGAVETCSIFQTPKEAFDTVTDGYDGDDFQIVPITRSVEVVTGEPIQRIEPCPACGAPVVNYTAGTDCPDCGEELTVSR